jgi:hypothetical protein
MCKPSQWSHRQAVRADLAAPSATWPIYKEDAKDLDEEGVCVYGQRRYGREVETPAIWMNVTDLGRGRQPWNMWAT